MPLTPATYLESARSLQAERSWDEAEAALAEGARRYPNDPDLNAAYGLCLCARAREAQALHYAEAASGDELIKTLAAHFHLKIQADRRLKISDQESSAALESIRELAIERGIDLNPLPDLRLSACMIVRDEEAHLTECLATLDGICDEIVVVDTGSTDNTVKIAESFGAVIGHFDWCDDFSAARNASLELASGNWALWIDADERLSPNSLTALLSAMVRPHFGGFTIPMINFLSDDLTRDRLEHRPCRLFRLHPSIRFEGKIHEQITTSIEALGLQVAQLDGIHIDHFGYQKSEIERKGKAQRTFSMLESELALNPTDSFHLFNLGNAYFSAGRFEEAAETFSRADVNGRAPHAQFMMHLWAFALLQVARHDEAIEVCDRAEKSGIGGILIDYARSCILAEQGRLEEALAAVRAARGKKLAPGEPGDRAIEQHRAKSLESSILLELNRAEEAVVAAREAFASAPTHRDLWIGWLRAAEMAEDGSELVTAFSAGADQFEFDAELCVAAGRAFESTGRNQNALECYQQAIETQPDHANAYFCAADLLLRQGFALEAAEAYQKGLGFEPYFAEGWFMLGNALYRAGSYDGAALAYRQALELDESHDRAAANLAIITEDESERAA